MVLDSANNTSKSGLVIAYYVSRLFILSSAIFFVPVIFLSITGGDIEQFIAFILPASILFFIGFILRKLLHIQQHPVLSFQNSGIVILISWLTVCVLSALPFIIILKIPFSHAFFESISGWTTTGLSVIDVEKTPNAVLLWRSIMQLCGGAGLAIIMLAVLGGFSGTLLYSAEGKSDQLVPNVRKSAKIVISLYALYAIFGIVAYYLFGMSFFDAINHSFAAISTGGFSTHSQSIGYWDSVGIEYITIILMLLGNLNFITAYLLFRGKIKSFVCNGEIKISFVLIITTTLFILLFVCFNSYGTLGKDFRVAFFETISALTTTGFTTTDYSIWHSSGIFVLIILMIIGGGMCSTAGGLKQYRVFLLYKSFIWEIKRILKPRNAVIENHVWYGETKLFINAENIRQISVYTFIYFLFYAIGVVCFLSYGYSMEDSLFEFASVLSTVGLSKGIISFHTEPALLWVSSAGMFLGRLEFVVVFVSLMKIINDFTRKIR